MTLVARRIHSRIPPALVHNPDAAPSSSAALQPDHGRMHRMLALLIPLVAPLLLVRPSPGLEAPAPWRWPAAQRVAVVRPFDPPPLPWLKGHRGVDLDLDGGAVVLAPAPGRVAFAGVLAGRPVLALSHGRIRSTYEPVVALVEVGEEVRAGQAVAVLVDGHEPSGLHWGAKLEGDHYIDPLRMLQGPIGLKPWE